MLERLKGRRDRRILLERKSRAACDRRAAGRQRIERMALVRRRRDSQHCAPIKLCTARDGLAAVRDGQRTTGGSSICNRILHRFKDGGNGFVHVRRLERYCIRRCQCDALCGKAQKPLALAGNSFDFDCGICGDSRLAIDNRIKFRRVIPLAQFDFTAACN